MRIYFVLLRFFASSLLASIIDFVAFAFVFNLSGNTLTSMLVGRGVALSANYVINKKLVFQQRKGGIAVFLRYLALVVLLGAISYLLIREMQDLFDLNTLLAKVVAESVLFIMSFSVQREIVFADYRLERGDRDDGL
jgi:putative flippase GtrA